MTVHTPIIMSKDAFCDWVARQEGRYELAGGRVMMMVHVTRNHATVTLNLATYLKSHLNGDQYDIASESFGVDVGDGLRFPDIVVEPTQSDGHALEAKAPILIAEVLSPGTQHTDFGEKRQEYLALPTLDTYLVLAADEPRVWAWRRVDGVFSPEPEIVEGTDKSIALPVFGIALPMAEIYRGVR